MLPSFDAVLLDMDGTLVDTEGLWFEAEQAVAARFGAVVPTQAAPALHGLDSAALVATLQREHGLTVDAEEFLAALLPEVLERLAGARAREGAGALVERLAGARLARAIVSNSDREVIGATLAPHDWAGLVPLRFSVDDVARGKPEPDLYLHAARALGTEPGRCLAIEDSLTGAQAAKRAGMSCLVVTFGRPPATGTERSADRLVASLGEAELLLAQRLEPIGRT